MDILHLVVLNNVKTETYGGHAFDCLVTITPQFKYYSGTLYKLFFPL